MTVGAALILVFVLIAAYFCVRRGPSNGGHGGRNGRKGRPGNDNRISYTETHIPLQKGIDDCIDCVDDHNSGGTALTPMLPDHERNPDIIPISRRGEWIHVIVCMLGGVKSMILYSKTVLIVRM